MPYPSALKCNPKVIFFTDFDGTITLADSNDYLTDHLGFGQELRKQMNKDVLDGKKVFREIFQDMMDSVKVPFPECIQILLDKIKLDPSFKVFYQWARANNVPVIVLSSGMIPIISALLQHLLGPEAKDIEIVANDCVDRDDKKKEEEGGWTIKFHDDSGFGHDKSLAIRPYAKHFDDRPGEPRPTMLYAGDGVSDLSAARETDLLFAKKGHDLVTYCEREGLPFTLFEDWTTILEKTKDIYEGKTSVKKVAAEGIKEAQADAKEKPTVK